MESQIICSHCNEQFRDDNLPRILIGCGHTFCQSCLASFIVQDDQCIYAQCPDDQTQTQLSQLNVSKLPKNLALIKVIENKKQNSSFRDNEINVSKITKNSSAFIQDDVADINSMIDDKKNEKSIQQAKQKISKPKSIKQISQQLCKLHRKPLDIVCTVDLKKICASCAIFGEHRGHSFKSLDQISQIQQQYCTSITRIIQQKQKISKQIDCSQTKNDILSILTSKKAKLRTKIVQQFQKLQQKIVGKKKQTLKSLDQIVKKQQQNLKKCMKFDENLVKNYNQWLKKSQSQLKILEQSDFQAKLILLFEGTNIDGDIVEEGKNLIDQMKLEQQNILTQVEKKLQNLKMNVNQQIYNHVDDFIQVTGQSYKQISNIIVKADPIIINQSQRPSLAPISINTTLNNIVLPNQSLKPLNNKGDITERRVQPIKMYENASSSYLQSQPLNINLDQSLLQNDEQPNQPQVVQFQPRMSVMSPPTVPPIPLTQRFSIQSNRQSPTLQKQQINKLKIPNYQPIEPKGQKMNKKKLSRLKLPERFQKVVESLLADSLEIVDFTSGEFGDVIMSSICENLVGTKARNLKLIRNKLTDQGVAKILPYLGQIVTLNLSQNLLTDNILDILFDNQKSLSSLKTVILSQNKIVERKHKAKIEKLKKLQWNISL